MKQNISSSQLNELSDKGKEKLRNWWKPKFNYGDRFIDKLGGFHTRHGGDGFGVIPDKELLPLLSIGQMIEFLDDHKWKENLVITKGGPYEIVKLPGQEKLPDKIKRAWYIAELTKEGLVFGGYGSRVLADALWESVKEVLN